MSFFSEIRKLLFGAKSVAKNQGRQARENVGDWADKARQDLEEMGRETGDKVRSAADEIFGEKTGKEEELRGTGDWVVDESATDYREDDLVDSSRSRPVGAPPTEKSSLDFEEGLNTPPPPREPSELEKLGNDLLDRAARLGNEAKEAAERTGKKVLDASEKAGGRIREKAEELGGELKGRADELVERASRAAEQDSLDEAIRKAREMEEQSAARARAFDNREGDRDTSDSTLSGTGSFFERADRFAKGDYHNEEGKPVRLQKDPDYKAREKPNKIHGFDDKDGDGDDLIDDAIIDED